MWRDNNVCRSADAATASYGRASTPWSSWSTKPKGRSGKLWQNESMDDWVWWARRIVVDVERDAHHHETLQRSKEMVGDETKWRHFFKKVRIRNIVLIPTQVITLLRKVGGHIRETCTAYWRPVPWRPSPFSKKVSTVNHRRMRNSVNVKHCTNSPMVDSSVTWLVRLICWASLHQRIPVQMSSWNSIILHPLPSCSPSSSLSSHHISWCVK